MNLFRKTPFAYGKVVEWAERDEEFVRRAGFALLACLAGRDKDMDDAAFQAFLPLIERHAGDGRNFAKMAVNWALREIGKRNWALNDAAIVAAKGLIAQGSPSARWIGRDALRELRGEIVLRRLGSR
jgi:3-methyladenine DNA glycosylase AlkD